MHSRQSLLPCNNTKPLLNKPAARIRHAVKLRAYEPDSIVSTSNPYGADPYGQDEYSTPKPVGARVEKWLKTPFDIAAFGPRAAAGALLSLPEKLGSLQSDVRKYVELLQDPRPLDEKQNVLLRDVEDLLVNALERGVNVEADVLTNLKTILPPQAADFITEFVPDPPLADSNQSVGGYGASDGTSAPADTMAAPQPPVTYYQEDVLANQLAAELTEIRLAVTGLKAALENVRLNNEYSKTNLLRQNLREARDQLARRLAEVSPATSTDPSINMAAREARILLDEVDVQFFQ